MNKKKGFNLWSAATLLLVIFFIIAFVYPLCMLLKSAFEGSDGYTLAYFREFFKDNYYFKTIWNSMKVSFGSMFVCLAIGIPFSYFYSFFDIKGKRLLLILCVLSTMSAPFIGAYSWIMLLGRNGLITTFLKTFLHINIGSIYGFGGILVTQATKLFPLVVIYMNGAFKNLDNSLLEASENLGVKGIKRLFKVTLPLTFPTILAAALLIFMRAFADFGTPMLIGEGYKTFPVEIYNQFVGEVGTNRSLACALSVVAIALTAVIFFIQKYLTGRFSFTVSSLHPIEQKKTGMIGKILMNFYCYFLIFVSMLPNIYIMVMSFRNYKNSVMQPGYSFNNYIDASNRLLGRSVKNTVVIGVVGLAIIIVLAIVIAYLVVRRGGIVNHVIDTVSMLPYIMPGTVVGIALIMAFNKKPLVLTGTMAIMILAVVIRRLPYCVRSTTATLTQISPSIDEAAISLGASKAKTFIKITVPMMKNGIISGGILSWVSIITEVSSALILYNNRTITLTMSVYSFILKGADGVAMAFAGVTTVFTVISMLVFMHFSNENDLKL